VIDTGSIDRTAEIARSFGANVFDFAWIDDFAAARNEALARATGDYAFWLLRSGPTLRLCSLTLGQSPWSGTRGTRRSSSSCFPTSPKSGAHPRDATPAAQP
jgi:hypothetical protein